MLNLIQNRFKMFNSMTQQNFILHLSAVALLLFYSLPALSHVTAYDTNDSPTFGDRVTKLDAKDRLLQLNSIVDIEVTDEVQERIQQYTYYYRSSAEKILGRVGIYFPIFEKEIRRRGMPDDLKYIAVVESLLNPMATSKAGAAGLWQFMRSTGKMVGLEVNSEVDQRRSIDLSTQAALDYLQSLHDRFGDWSLAIAAYNCGPGNMWKAIKKAGSKDYWELRKYLPKETQKYLPRIIAAMYLTNYYQHHGLQPISLERAYYRSVLVKVKGEINLNKISSELGLDTQILKDLNPAYLKNRIPNSKGQYSLRIPSSVNEKYLEIYEPGVYSLLIEKREEAKRIKRLEIEKQKAAEELAYRKSMARDTINALEEIVTLIFKSLHSEGEKKYCIPSKMRSKALYVKV